MFWVTQAGWASAAGASHTAAIIVPARTANLLVIFLLPEPTSLMARLRGKYDERAAGGQAAGGSQPPSKLLGPKRRHCERSEAIHIDAKRKSGLLRYARNDSLADDNDYE